MIIGVTGNYASGKDSVADILQRKNFYHVSFSDILREKLTSLGKEITRDNLIEFGNEIRREKGNDILAKLSLEKVTDNRDYVFTSIRNPDEVRTLQERKDFVLVNVIASETIRLERILKRERREENEPKTLEELREKEARENTSDPSKQQLNKVGEMANITLDNSSTIKNLEEGVEKLLTSLKSTKRTNYISWDKYFMGIALLSAQRSKDPNTQVGACIVDPKNKIVGIGYNGFPIGCSDDELPWGVREAENEMDTKYPYIVHAELNAVLNSRGKLNDSKIYTALFPCNECAKVIIQSRIKEVIYLNDKYRETDSVKASKKMFDMAGVKYKKIEMDKESIVLNFDDQ